MVKSGLGMRKLLMVRGMFVRADGRLRKMLGGEGMLGGWWYRGVRKVVVDREWNAC